MNAELNTRLAGLREPFPASQIGQLPRAGITLDYVGHGAVTDRLLTVDPEWSWEPVSFDQMGLPAMERDDNGHPIALWIRLTVCGVTRYGVGTCPGNQSDAEKVLIGDALRNAAMRFGVALDLWIRGQSEDDEKASSGQRSSTQRKRSTAKPPDEDGPILPGNAAAIVTKCGHLGLSVAEVVNAATNGRTGDPEKVLRSEVGAVKDAMDTLTPADAPA